MKKHVLFIIFALSCSLVFSQETTKKITLEDIWGSPKFFPAGVRGMMPMANGEHYSVLEKDSINVYSYKTGEYIRTIASGSQMVPEGDTLPIKINSYGFSADEKKLLIPTKTRSIYRYSSESDYFIWDLPAQELTPLSMEGKQRLADFSPDGSKIAYVRNNNIIVKDFDKDLEFNVTHDGEENKIINGTTDWVYEEEFAITKAFHWSPDGKKIAYLRFDESEVKEYWMTTWGQLYPGHHKYKYPKAGEDNSVVTVHVYNLENGQTTEMDIGEETDQYIPRIFWTKDPEVLAIFRVNRLQNKFEMLYADISTGESTPVHEERSHTYIEESHYDNVIFLDDGEFIFTSEMDDYYHIYYKKNDEIKPVQLTSGEWDVTSMLGFDENGETVYFTAARNTPVNREIYSVNLKGKIKLIADQGGWHSPRFSSDFSYYLDSFSTANTPPVYTVNRSNGKVLRVLEDNRRIEDLTEEYGFSELEFFNFETSEGVSLNGFQILPPGFDPSGKYPLFMYVYGGPGSQTVTNRWNYFNFIWFQMLAQNGYIVVSVDNRGTGARGQEFKKMTYLELGKYETIDQIEAAKFLAAKEYVDPDRIGIFGWSYGGYLSTLCLTKGAEYFNTAIAVAPVTNWRYYDNIYTERFMRRPQQNASGYDDNSPINHVDKMEGNFLLVHGTGDDNVHVQNTMDLIDALVEADKQFELMLYPNRNHGIYGGNTRLHLYRKMTDFIFENL